MRAMTGDQVQCRDDGMFEPRQCRINPQRGDGSSQEEITATCSCVRPLDGEIIRNTTRRVTRKDQAPDCESRSKAMSIVRLQRELQPCCQHTLVCVCGGGGGGV